jgi:beta-N-acetylhexosaminidase
MVAAESAGGIPARIAAHREAGCDLVLVCRPEAVPDALRATRGQAPCAAGRIATLAGGVAATWQALLDNPQRDRFVARLATLTESSTGIPA